MFIGHAALGLAAKPLAPRVPLAALLVATYWPDIVWPVLLLAGWERVRIDPGNTAFTPLDFVSHRPDLPLWPGSTTTVGLGLWHSVPATILVECAMFAAGAWIYARSTPARDRTGRVAYWGLIVFLAGIYFANAFGPPPPSATAIAVAGIAGAALFIAWAGWIDRHRGAS